MTQLRKCTRSALTVCVCGTGLAGRSAVPKLLPGQEVSLYDDKIASMEGVKSWYNQSDATGFIRLNGLRLRARNLSQGGPKI